VLETQLLSSALPSSLLEKTHLRLTVSVYNSGMLWLRACAVWLLLMAVETIHGILRSLLLVPLVGDFRARQIGVFIGSALILAISFLTIRWIGMRGTRQQFMLGLFWTVLTVAFEFALGRALGFSWQRVLSDYDLRHGGLMLIGLAILFLAPFFAARVRTSSAR
jgi:peptidoglycan/LPS O-acetylase OafA/YrhL